MIGYLIRGIKAYSGTFELISRLGLWKYFGIPIIISFLTAIFIGLASWGFSDSIGKIISKIWLWEWGAESFSTFSSILAGILIIIIGFILYKHIVLALSAPFMSAVSEKIEKHIIGRTLTRRHTSSISQLWRGIRINIRNLMMELLLTIPIFLIGFIPVIGFISAILLFLVQSYYAGFGNMDYTLERHFEVKESIQFVRKYKGVAIGNGMLFMLMLLIPIVGIIIVLPLSVTAASRETIQLIRDSKRL